jgi:pantetheine-phosphate adenylyltransferase
MKIAVYPGTFDPVTNGHIDLIRRARAVFQEVVVGVAENPGKGTLFSVEERVEMLREATRRLAGVKVEPFDGLSVSFARRKKARVILRGLRMLSDFEYEFQLALTNRRLDPHVETVFLMPSAETSYLSSRLIKEAAGLGADVTGLVPSFVARRLKERLKNESAAE